MNIQFPDLPLRYTVDTTVGFAASVDGVTRLCEISEEALQDQFGARTNTSADLFGAFALGSEQIHGIAADKINAQNNQGRILITNNDF